MIFICKKDVFRIVGLAQNYWVVIRIHSQLFAVPITNIARRIYRYSQSIVKLLAVVTPVNRIESPIAVVDLIKWNNFKYLRGFYVGIDAHGVYPIVLAASFIYLSG